MIEASITNRILFFQEKDNEIITSSSNQARIAIAYYNLFQNVFRIKTPLLKRVDLIFCIYEAPDDLDEEEAEYHETSDGIMHGGYKNRIIPNKKHDIEAISEKYNTMTKPFELELIIVLPYENIFNNRAKLYMSDKNPFVIKLLNNKKEMNWEY